jgi:hypothetical protein
MENKANYKQYRDMLLKEEFTTAPVVPYLGRQSPPAYLAHVSAP